MPSKLTNIEFIEKCVKLHGDKFDYIKVNYVGQDVPIVVICKTHGEFVVTPKRFSNPRIDGLKNNGCIYCFREKSIIEKRNRNRLNFFNKCFDKFGNLYDYSLSEYINQEEKIKIICNKHGVFEQKPINHLISNVGCPKCQKDLERKPLSKFIEQSKKLHGDKYIYDHVIYENTHKKVIIECVQHGLFEQVPKDHIKGVGCSICKESIGEKEVRNYLNQINVEFIAEHKFSDCKSKSLLRFDFYIPSINMCIEFDGAQHFEPVDWFGGEKAFLDLKNRDEIKNLYCSKNNIKLIRIKYNDNINNILDQIFKLDILV